MPEITRREFLKLGAAGTAGMALVPLANPLGFDLAAANKRALDLRIAGAKEVHSLCPYCAVGCSLIAYTKQMNGKTQLLQIEGDPDSPVNEGRLCPKGATAMQLATSSRREEKPKHRSPGRTEGAEKPIGYWHEQRCPNLQLSPPETPATSYRQDERLDRS